MSINIKKKARGFGIIEVLISGVIIIIILGALVVLAKNAINNSQYVKERSQAVNLAQEGMEIVRQIRDSNYIDGTPSSTWKAMAGEGSNQNIENGPLYYVSYDNFRFRLLSGSAPAINLDGNKFYRTIRFTGIESSTILKSPNDVNNEGKNGVVAKVTVTWPNSTGDHEVELEELLTNSRFQF